MKRILVPVDFSPCSENAVNFAVQFAKHTGAEIVLMHSYEKAGSLYTEYVGVNNEFTRQQMTEELTKLRQIERSIEETEGINVITYEYQGPANENIIKTIYDKAIDLVVMGTLGNSGIREMLVGSKTAQIINKSEKPVIAVPFNYDWSEPEKIMLTTTHFEENETVPGFVFEMAALFDAEVHITVFTEDDTTGRSFTDELKLQHYFYKLEARYPGIKIIPVHLKGHHFEESLREYIDKNQIGMLAMVNYHRSFFDRLFHPSKTRHMSYLTNIPLLAIPGIVE